MYTSINKSQLQRPNKGGGNVPNSNCSQSLTDFPTDDEGDRFGASQSGALISSRGQKKDFYLS